MNKYVCTANRYEIKYNRSQMTHSNSHTQRQISIELELKVNELKSRVRLLEDELTDKKGLIESLIDKQKANGKQDNRE
jgi:hypothetical protein